MTTKELTVAYENLGQAVNHMSTLVANDIQQIMGVLAGMLEHMGLLEHFKCPSCGEDLSHPKLDGVQRPTHLEKIHNLYLLLRISCSGVKVYEQCCCTYLVFCSSAVSKKAFIQVHQIALISIPILC